MNGIIQLCVVALAAAFCAVALKKYAPETSAVIAVAAAAMILLHIIGELSPLSETIASLTEGTGINNAAAVLMKTVGICYLAGFTSDACRDTGNSSLAARVEAAARIAIVITALPLINTVLTTVRELLNVRLL